MSKETGWIPDDWDPKDFTLSNKELRKLLLQSQGIQKLATIIQDVLTDLEQMTVPLFNVKIVQLKEETMQLIGDIQSLNVEEDPNILNLVPALLLKGSGTESSPSEQRGDTEVRIEPPAQYFESGGGAAPEIPPDLLYLPILGNCGVLLKQSLPLQRLPRVYQLHKSCRSRVEDQGALNRQSCTAHAAVALMEYFEMRRRAVQTPAPSGDGVASGAYTGAEPAIASNLSSRFLYKVTRLMAQRSGDRGAALRDTLKAMLLFGVPPEASWPWPLPANATPDAADDEWDAEPSAFCYAYAKNYQAVKYFRLDRPGISQPALLAQIKVALLADFPVIFGFRVFSGLTYENAIIPYPHSAELTDITDANPDEIQGHTVVAIGYNDDQVIPGHRPGAIYFKNSWGASWGEAGYGWLPYDYVLQATDGNKLTRDWWTLIGANWTQTQQFGLTLNERSTILGKEPSEVFDTKPKPKPKPKPT